MEKEYKIRHRVNFSQTTKGQITCDVTAEIIDGTQEEVIKEAKELLQKAMEVAKSEGVGTVFQIK